MKARRRERKIRHSLYRPGRENEFLADLQVAALGGEYDMRGVFHEVSAERKARAAKRIGTHIDDWFHAPETQHTAQVAAFRKRIEAFSTKGDWPEVLEGRFDIFQGEETYDQGWAESFKDAIKLPNLDHFVITDVKRGFYFQRMQEGERVKVQKMSGSRVQVFMEWFATAFGWSEQSVRYRRLSDIVDSAEQIRDAYWERKSDDHYKLLYAACDDKDRTTTYKGGTTLSVEKRDAKTLNTAYTAMAKRLYGKLGFKNTVRQRVNLYYHIEIEDRVHAALKLRSQAMDSSPEEVRFPINPIPTLNPNIVKNPLHMVMVFPENKIQKATDLEPVTYRDSDMYTLSYVNIIWTSYGAGVGDVEQCQKVQLG